MDCSKNAPKKNQDNFFTAIFIDCINCRIVGEAREVTNLKGIGFWGQTDNLFLHQLSYILLQFLYL